MKDGGPAFPSLQYSDKNEVGDEIPFASYDGMSLRDYFAAKAMQSILSFAKPSNPQYDMAKAAYMYADAMLKERDNPHD